MNSSAPLTVVVPTRNRKALLRRCLSALERSRLGTEQFHVVVVDDAGTVDLREVVEARSLSLELLRQENCQGPAAARNRGARAASSPLLAFTDDDCVPTPDWLSSIAAAHRAWPGAAIGGRIRNGSPDNPFCGASQALFDYLYETGNPDPSNATFFASCNLAVPRGKFLALGGFDESFPLAAGEDRAFCIRWCAAGERLVYAADADVEHAPDLDLRSYFRQHFRYGRGARRLRREVEGAPSLESPGFYAGILAAARGRGRAEQVSLTALLGLSQVATACGYLAEVLQPSRRSSAPVGRSR